MSGHSAANDASSCNCVPHAPSATAGPAKTDPKNAGGPVPSEPERGGGAPAPAPLRPHASEKERLRLAAEALRAPGDDAAAASAAGRNSWLVQTQAQNAAWQREQAALRAGGELWVVGNLHLAYEKHLKRVFGACDTVAANGKFAVLRATRR